MLQILQLLLPKLCSPEQECSHSIWKLLRRKAELMCGTGCCCELEQLLRNKVFLGSLVLWD